MAGKLATRGPRGLSAWRRDPLSTLRDEMDELLSRLWGNGEEDWIGGPGSPSLDLAETDTALEARVDLPGIKPDEIDVQLNENYLTISGEREEEKEEKGRKFHRVERRTGTFSRCVALPCRVQEDKVTARYDAGILSVTLPKAEEAKAHKVKIK